MKFNQDFINAVEADGNHDPLGTILCALRWENRDNPIAYIDQYEIEALVGIGALQKNFVSGEYEWRIPPIVQEVKIDDFDEFVESYRWYFSKENLGQHFRPGAMGDKSDIKKKLRALMKESKMTKENIIDTVEYYTGLLKSNKLSYSYQADYFIKKNGKSPLKAFFEEYQKEGNQFSYDRVL